MGEQGPINTDIKADIYAIDLDKPMTTPYATVCYHVVTPTKQDSTVSDPRIPFCTYHKPDDFSRFIEENVLGKQYACEDGQIYTVVGFTNSPIKERVEEPDGTRRPLNDIELQFMSAQVKAALSGE